MAEPTPFEELIRQVRAGDQDAASELVRRYEPAIRRAIHFRLGDAHLGGMLDSMDICQSVLASFFLRAATGQYELKTPDQLLRLLATMARNKLAEEYERQRAARRDQRRIEPGALEERMLASPTASPSRQASAR